MESNYLMSDTTIIARSEIESKQSVSVALEAQHQTAKRADGSDNCPVKPLGHVGSTHYVFLLRETGQIVSRTNNQLNESGLRGFAEKHDWAHYKGRWNVDGQLNWRELADHLMALCRKAGPHDPSRVRGRGVWRDGDHLVYHAGSSLYVDGQRQEVHDFPSKRFTYIRERELLLPASEAVAATDVQLGATPLNDRRPYFAAEQTRVVGLEWRKLFKRDPH